MVEDKAVSDEQAGRPANPVSEHSVAAEDAAPELSADTPRVEPAENENPRDSATTEPAATKPAAAEELDLEFSEEELITDDELEVEEGDEDASPIEEFVEVSVVRSAEQDSEMNWYILKVQVNRENSICDALQRRVKIAGLDHMFGEILVPTEDVREFNKAGKQRIVKRKLYPGYIVVNMIINDDSWFLVRETPGIGDFTGAAGKPAPLTKEEIDRIIATTKPEVEETGESDNIKTSIKFKVGDRVRVKEGYFQNYEGEVSAIDERNGRITVMINIFGRLNPVELDHWHVEDL